MSDRAITIWVVIGILVVIGMFMDDGSSHRDYCQELLNDSGVSFQTFMDRCGDVVGEMQP